MRISKRGIRPGKFTWVVVLAAIVLCTCYIQWRSSRRQNAIQGIEGLGGVVYQKWVSERAGWLLMDRPASSLLPRMFMRPFKVEVVAGALKPEHQPFGDAELQSLIVHLAQLPDVEILNLSDLPISDAGLSDIGSLKVSSIGFTNCPITDNAVPQLKQLNCSEFGLVGTEMTPAGCRELQAALPDCRIYFDPDGDVTLEERQAYDQVQSYGF